MPLPILLEKPGADSLTTLLQTVSTDAFEYFKTRDTFLPLTGNGGRIPHLLLIILMKH